MAAATTRRTFGTTQNTTTIDTDGEKGRETDKLPIRIYALAKQLKIDGKVLVDICNRIGITGKGSALASLSDEEVAAG